MSTPWTPGPYIAIPSKIRRGRVRDERPLFEDGLWDILPASRMEQLPLCTVDRGDDHYPPCRVAAEHLAKLFAAAPDLYETCEQAKKYLERDLVEPGRTVFWNLVAALAKARGVAL